MADSSVRARLVAHRLGESFLYADRVAHQRRAKASAVNLGATTFAKGKFICKIWDYKQVVQWGLFTFE